MSRYGFEKNFYRSGIDTGLWRDVGLSLVLLIIFQYYSVRTTSKTRAIEVSMALLQH